MRDEIAVWNERVKLIAGFFNALALGLIGFALIRPVTEDVSLISPVSGLWSGIGLAMHGFALYILGRIRKKEEP